MIALRQATPPHYCQDASEAVSGASPCPSSLARNNKRDGRASPQGPTISSLVPKSNGPGWNRQKQPFFRQQRLNRRPLPQGQRSFRPSFSSSSFSPWTRRTPTLTFVSEGYPRRRLLIGSKGTIVARPVVVVHGAPPFMRFHPMQAVGHGRYRKVQDNTLPWGVLKKRVGHQLPDNVDWGRA